MNLIDTGTDPWIVERDACEKVAIEIMENLNLRDSEQVSSQAYDALSAKIRIRLKQYASEVAELKRKLNLASVVSTLTPEEKERRQRQVEVLLSKEIQLTGLFNRGKKKERNASDYSDERRQLLGTKRPNEEATANWGEFSSAGHDDKSLDEMREEQERLLKEQDKGLDTLLKIVSAQKQIATSINNEVEHHNEILVDIADGMERVDGRINRATDLVKVIQKKDSIWGYWLVAFLLLIAIIGVTLA